MVWVALVLPIAICFWGLVNGIVDFLDGRRNTMYIDVPVGPATGRPRPVRVPEWTYTTTTTRKRLMSRPNDPYPKP